MRLRTLAGTVLLLALPLSACASSNDAGSDASPSAPAQSLPDTAWDLASYVPVGESAPLEVPADILATAEFTADQIAGSGGCNVFSGGYTTDGSAIDIGPLAGTAKACLGAAMSLERDYLTRLDQAATYALASDTLTMSDSTGEVVLAFTKAVHAPLIGTTWSATGINTGTGGVSPPQTGTTVNAVFADDGAIAGDAGCNTYSGTFEVSDRAMTISSLTTTDKACEPDVSDQEANFLAALGRVTTYSIRGNVLELRDDEGALQAGFTA